MQRNGNTMETDARPVNKRPRAGEERKADEEPLAPPSKLSPADVRAALKDQHRQWVWGLPSVPPPLEENTSRVAVLHNIAESLAVLDKLIVEHLPSAP